MKNERRQTLLSIIINSLITFAKIYAGVVFSSYTLMVSGYNTLQNASLDFIAYTASIIRGRRANKKEPFGYGKLESLSVILFGLIIIVLGVYIIIKSFFLTYNNPNLRILMVVLLLSLSLIIYAKYLFKKAKEEQSVMLFTLSHDRYLDGICTLILTFFIFLGSFISVFDMLGSIFGGIIFTYKGIIIIVNQILLLKGKNDQSKRKIKRIKELINEVDGIKYSGCTFLNVNNFYKVTIEVLIDDNITLDDLILWEEYQKGNIKAEKLNIQFIDFLIYKK